MAARARTLRVVNPLALMARVLRGVADRIDPPATIEPVRVGSGMSDMYVCDFVRGEVRLRGKVIYRG
jgi:hypothetical protein